MELVGFHIIELLEDFDRALHLNGKMPVLQYRS